MKKIRLDKMLVSRGLAPTLEKARALIMAGAVRVGEDCTDKAGTLVPDDARIHVRGSDNPFVSRGGLKLAAALKEFNPNIAGLVAMDVGASTGGFTDCLLQAGVRKVYALDVAYGQLAWKLRRDARVVAIERTNIRYYDGADLDEKPHIAVIDVSFISLKTVLPAVVKLIRNEGSIIALIKPQFEARREEAADGGVVKDPRVHARVVEEIAGFCRLLGFAVVQTSASAITGADGNQEFFIYARKAKSHGD